MLTFSSRLGCREQVPTRPPAAAGEGLWAVLWAGSAASSLPPSLPSVLVRRHRATEHRAGGPGARPGETPFQWKSHKMPSGPQTCPAEQRLGRHETLGSSTGPPRPDLCACGNVLPIRCPEPAPSVSHGCGGSGSQRQADHLWGSLHSLQAFCLRGWQVLKHLGLPLRVRKQTTQEETS